MSRKTWHIHKKTALKNSKEGSWIFNTSTKTFLKESQPFFIGHIQIERNVFPHSGTVKIVGHYFFNEKYVAALWKEIRMALRCFNLFPMVTALENEMAGTDKAPNNS